MGVGGKVFASVASAYRQFLCTTTSSKIGPLLPSASVRIYVHLLFISMHSCASGCTSCLGQMSRESGLQAVIILQPISSVSICYPAPLWADVCCLHSLLSDLASRALNGKTISKWLGANSVLLFSGCLWDCVVSK